MSDRPESAVLAEAAAAAGYAPSVHNTQPWRWRVSERGLDLFADRSRQLQVADTHGRLLVMSCGAALHHLRVALAAQGWAALVQRMPDPNDPDHLAHVDLGERVEVTAEAMRLFQAIRLRHTDRRPVSDTPVAAEALDAVRAAMTAEGIDVHVLTADQVLELGSASARADQIEVTDPQQLEELAYWVGGDRASGVGVPDTALVDSPPQTVVPGRDFVRQGTLRTGEGHDREAAYAVLFGQSDEPADWLRAGEAMSAGWLIASELGLSVLPFSAVIEVLATREFLRRLLSGVGSPYLVLRLGSPDPLHSGPPHTPRLPAEQIIEMAD
ncbi:Acg family FMN-binding oxidoreductase [Rhizocola hellebori]|nr:nitroreductase [Rhizocola hellebori]